MDSVLHDIRRRTYPKNKTMEIRNFLQFTKVFALLCPAAIYLLIFINVDSNWYSSLAEESQNHIIPETTTIKKNLFDSIKDKIRSFGSPKEMVLIVSTFGRSGSSWLSELVSSDASSFYIFEPLYFHSIKLHQEMSPSNVAILLKSQFQCNFHPGLIEYAKSRVFSSVVFQSFYTKNVCKNATICITESNVKSNCEQSRFLLIKTIRTPLSVGDTLLKDRYFQNLKIVFLVRDPRAALSSRSRLGWDESDPYSKCQSLDSDVKWYKTLRKEYPKNVYIIRYEDMCINPKEEATSLWRFLKGNPNLSLSPTWRRYLMTHSKSNRRGRKEESYSTYRNTLLEWISWRREIKNETFLQEVENYCKPSMESLGYNAFGTLSNLYNTTVSMFIPNSLCPRIPCDKILL